MSTWDWGLWAAFELGAGLSLSLCHCAIVFTLMFLQFYFKFGLFLNVVFVNKASGENWSFLLENLLQ